MDMEIPTYEEWSISRDILKRMDADIRSQTIFDAFRLDDWTDEDRAFLIRLMVDHMHTTTTDHGIRCVTRAILE